MHIPSHFIFEILYTIYIYTTNNVILGLVCIFPHWETKNLNFKERGFF
jgi:hypothetical protein